MKSKDLGYNIIYEHFRFDHISQCLKQPINVETENF